MDANVTVVPVIKNNGYKYDVIQMENRYEQYKNGEITMSECEGGVVEVREERECKEIYKEFAESGMTWGEVKDKIFPIRIGTAANEELLASLVHKDFQDMSITYILRNLLCRYVCNSIKITHFLMQI